MFNISIVSGSSVGLAQNNAIDARQLWEALEVPEKFADWVQRRFEECQAIENVDFLKIKKPNENNRIDYIVALDIAKHIAMLERTDIGRTVRQYFINIEKQQKPVLSGDPIDVLLYALSDTRKRMHEHDGRLQQHDVALSDVKGKMDNNTKALAATILSQAVVNGDSRLTAAQVSELDSEMHKKFLAMGRNTLAASVLKKQIKQKWLTPPLTTKTYKDCASKDFPEIIKFVKTFRFGGR